MLASGETLTKIAQQLHLNRSTLYEWQTNQAFQCYYNQQCQEFQQDVKNALFGLHRQAVDTLNELLERGNENTRLKAALWIIERVASIKVGEVEIKEVLKRKCTHNTAIYDLNELDLREYERELAKYGLQDD